MGRGLSAAHTTPSFSKKRIGSGISHAIAMIGRVRSRCCGMMESNQHVICVAQAAKPQLVWRLFFPARPEQGSENGNATVCWQLGLFDL